MACIQVICWFSRPSTVLLIVPQKISYSWPLQAALKSLESSIIHELFLQQICGGEGDGVEPSSRDRTWSMGFNQSFSYLLSFHLSDFLSHPLSPSLPLSLSHTHTLTPPLSLSLSLSRALPTLTQLTKTLGRCKRQLFWSKSVESKTVVSFISDYQLVRKVSIMTTIALLQIYLGHLYFKQC